MKKLTTTLGVLILIGVLVTPGLAHRWSRGEWSGGQDYCWRGGGNDGTLTQSQRAELDKLEREFINDTAKLKDELWAASTELSTLLNSSPEPDAEKARALQRRISELRAKIDEHRIEFELRARKISPGALYAQRWRGHHGSYGHHGPYRHQGLYGHHWQSGGYGSSPCWNR
jgi:hypothetical protein